MAEVNAACILRPDDPANPNVSSDMVARVENFIHGDTIPLANSEPRPLPGILNCINISLVLEGTGEPLQKLHQKLRHCESTCVDSLHYFVHTVYFLCFIYLGFVCRSMPMLEKRSMPLAVRLAGITNCHVFVHALRTIK